MKQLLKQFWIISLINIALWNSATAAQVPVQFPVTHNKKQSTLAVPSIIAANQLSPQAFKQLPRTTQQTIAKRWQLSAKDYGHYLDLKHNTSWGFYYQGKHLDPNWLLAMAENNQAKRTHYEKNAIALARQKVAAELRFNREFSQLEKNLYPKQKPIELKPHRKH